MGTVTTLPGKQDVGDSRPGANRGFLSSLSPVSPATFQYLNS
jgi:hypothetical protein